MLGLLRRMEMLQKVEICIVYRARLVSIEEKDFVFKKPLISFYSILKQVDCSCIEYIIMLLFSNCFDNRIFHCQSISH